MAIFYKRDADSGELIPFKLIDNGDGTFSESASGGGSGGAVTIADDAHIALGAKADTEAATDTATASLLALFKRLLNTKLAFGQKTRANSISVAQANDAIAANAPQFQGANVALSGTAAAINNDILAATDASTYRQGTIQLTGTWVAGVAVQVSLDAGTTWVSLLVYNVVTTTFATVLTVNGIYAFSIPANAQLRIRATAYTSGTVLGSVGLSATPNIQHVTAAVYLAGTPLIASTPNDVVSNANNGLQVNTYQLIYDAAAANWERVRVCNVFKDVNAVAAGSIVTVWTPTTGKKFNLMGGCISVSAACSVLFEDNAGGTFIYRTPKLLADTPFFFTVGGTNSNGILSAAANNVLKATSSAAANITGVLFGTEE